MTIKIVKESHIHDLNISIEEVLKHFENKEGFFIETIEFDEPVGRCGLWGPLMGDPPVDGPAEDEVFYQERGDRRYPSRMVNWPARQDNRLTVIAGPFGEDPCVLYTAFAGPLAPKEPNDPTIKEEEREASEAFWSTHALSTQLDGKN